MCVRDEHPEDFSQGEREVELAIGVKDAGIEHDPLYLRKAPVVLLHGIWSDAVANSGKDVSDGNFYIYPRWDINRDGKVDYKDLAILGASYGSCEGEPGYNPDADINEDGCIDYKDLAILGAHYGEEY